MNRKFSLFFLLMGMLTSQLTYSQEHDMKKLKTLFLTLKTLKSYAYETETKAVFPNGVKEEMKTTLAVDVIHKRLLNKNKNQVLLVTEKWVYKADLQQKTISLFNLSNQKNKKYKDQLPDLDRLFAGEVSFALMDSLIFSKGHLISAKTTGDQTIYRLGFPPQYYVKDMTITFNHKTNLPKRIYIKSFYPTSKGAEGKIEGTIYETVSTDYQSNLPIQIFDPTIYFQMKEGKVILNKFKDYKLSTIL